ncbi:isochorismate synthase [Lysinibacter sp. HNR]|uniref:isochorismate synthase n=1 Tax=Lysinibacter sp. HNR TaxID=3031408 RepID=UPI002435EF90|nr:isochorismate synthase [Lysinibacter sp. HNR]WGD37129.1 isochorismate synthase [Lysinibacter sp. HNR]
MTLSGQATPHVRVQTTAASPHPSLIPHLDPQGPQLWMRNNNGIAGIGTLLRLEFTGPTRFTDAADAWRSIVSHATIDDQVQLQGTGLIAFGTFAFADSSATTSVLHIPRIVIGRNDTSAWVTQIRFAHEDSFDTIPQAIPLGESYRVSFRNGSMSPSAFSEAVSRATTRITAGELEKVVLSRELVGEFPLGADRRLPLAYLSREYPDCWTFSIDGLFGASPETLIEAQNGLVHARVLAGTTARGTTQEEDAFLAESLATSSKNIAEHKLAVGSVLETLKPYVSQVSANDHPFLLKLPNLWHLATDVNARLIDTTTSLDLVSAVHPTAAVAGTPTPLALQLIEELENFDRGRYAGATGWLDSMGNCQWAVTLRCAQICGDTITAYAGSGIVAGSEPEDELAETQIKFTPIVDSLTRGASL